MTSVTHNPVEDWGDDTLKRRFSNRYADVHVHGIRDGVDVLAKLHLMELELEKRGYDPAEIIGPKVIS